MELGFDVNENQRDRKSNSSLKIKEELLKTSKNRTGFLKADSQRLHFLKFVFD